MLIYCTFAIQANGQQVNNMPVSVDSALVNDSTIPKLPNDTLSVNLGNDTTKLAPKRSESEFDAEINYTASDSIVLTGDGTGFLYGNTEVKYKELDLSQASYVRIKMDSAMIYAHSTRDSTGVLVGKPIFKDGESEYTSNEMTYNFRTKKGFVKQAVTQQGEGYIISDKTKIVNNEEIHLADGKYTTCDLHDHPHFYLDLSRGKIKPGEYVVFGPANLVLLDIPLPLALPFGFFPFNTSYSSGLEMPSIETELTRGYGLVNGGYYFAINDYVDLSLKGDIYTKGTWGVNLISNYLKRYKFRGGISVSYREDVTGEKDMPDYNKAKNLSIRWSHSQDPKVNPYRTFSASVNFSTSGYNRSNINSYYTSVNAENTKSSSIAFSQRFPNNPLSFTANFGIDQRTRDSTISITLPNVAISMSRIYPLKRKNRVGNEQWYEKISMSYSGTISNSITAKENKILQSSLADDWRNGMQHNIPLSASFNLLNYITISPSFNYRERWYLSSITKEWDSENREVDVTKHRGFKRVYDFNMSVSANTTLYGMYIPSRKLFGDKIQAIRHKLEPSVGYGYTPDFGDPKWGYWDSYIREFVDPKDPMRMISEEVHYSRYEGSMYGAPGRGKSGNVFFTLNNNLEMKLRNDKDTTGTKPTKIVSLIDQFSLSSGYNFIADSMKWSNFSSTLRIKLGKSYTLSLSGAFDPYMNALSPDGKSLRRVNKLRWNHGKFPRFLGTSMSWGYTFNNATFKRKDKTSDEGAEGDDADLAESSVFEDDPNNPNQNNSLNVQNQGTNKQLEKNETDDDGYEKISIPWSLSVNYSVRYGDAPTFDPKKLEYNRRFTHNLNFSGNLQLTPGWQISGTTSYDFEAKQFTYTSFNVTRNLHCWTLTGNFVPFGPYKTYNFRIGVNSSMLSDLKWEKQGNRGSINRVTWY
ncbi:MAG: LPS-assembly protein LptD [Porphyromonadaceae bacterium]|nr:LPS-assembly protein LptD [Porphyromonadaceae bacterium]